MFTVAEIAAFTGGRVIGDSDIEVTGISSDSRTIGPGELFIPLRGERFDGHAFLPGIADAGVPAALAETGWLNDNTCPEALTVIAVADTLQALGDLAAAFRQRYEIPLVGITGSNGKTTSKEMLAAIMEQIAPGLKTVGNLNNLIGLPRMLFQLEGQHAWAVLEMGMSEPGEIDRLAEIAAPQVGVVLNAFPAHLESMGTVANVARAKGELLLRLPEGGCAVVNGDDPLIDVLPVPAGVRRISFGCAEAAEVRAQDIVLRGIEGQSFTLVIFGEARPVSLAAFGNHSIYNALAAAAAATALGVPPDIIVSGLERFRPYDRRFALETAGELLLIDDSYNANPASTAAALATLAGLKGTRQAFVALGDMLELGGDQGQLHYQAGVQAARVADRLYLRGELTAATADGAQSCGMPADRIIRGLDHRQIAADIADHAAPGDLVLVKGSRGMNMELVADALRRRNG